MPALKTEVCNKSGNLRLWTHDVVLREALTLVTLAQLLCARSLPFSFYETTKNIEEKQRRRAGLDLNPGYTYSAPA